MRDRFRCAALAIAIGIAAVFAALHLAGARAHVGLLSGTAPASDADVVLGAAYALAWFGAVLVAPIAVLAVLLDAACGRLWRWRDSGAR